jgi:hypothetical protein
MQLNSSIELLVSNELLNTSWNLSQISNRQDESFAESPEVWHADNSKQHNCSATHKWQGQHTSSFFSFFFKANVRTS